MIGKQFVKKGLSYIGCRKRYRKRTKRRQRGEHYQQDLTVSAGAPFLGEIAKYIFKKNFWWQIKKNTMRKKVLL